MGERLQLGINSFSSGLFSSKPHQSRCFALGEGTEWLWLKANTVLSWSYCLQKSLRNPLYILKEMTFILHNAFFTVSFRNIFLSILSISLTFVWEPRAREPHHSTQGWFLLSTYRLLDMVPSVWKQWQVTQDASTKPQGFMTTYPVWLLINILTQRHSVSAR